PRIHGGQFSGLQKVRIKPPLKLERIAPTVDQHFDDGRVRLRGLWRYWRNGVGVPKILGNNVKIIGQEFSDVGLIELDPAAFDAKREKQTRCRLDAGIVEV